MVEPSEVKATSAIIFSWRSNQKERYEGIGFLQTVVCNAENEMSSLQS